MIATGFETFDKYVYIYILKIPSKDVKMGYEGAVFIKSGSMDGCGQTCPAFLCAPVQSAPKSV